MLKLAVDAGAGDAHKDVEGEDGVDGALGATVHAGPVLLATRHLAQDLDVLLVGLGLAEAARDLEHLVLGQRRQVRSTARRLGAATVTTTGTGVVVATPAASATVGVKGHAAAVSAGVEGVAGAKGVAAGRTPLGSAATKVLLLVGPVAATSALLAVQALQRAKHPNKELEGCKHTSGCKTKLIATNHRTAPQRTATHRHPL